MDIRRATTLIIKRGNQYLVGRVFGFSELRWSIYPYDAWSTRNIENAQRVAKRLGGRIILFNPVVKQMREARL